MELKIAIEPDPRELEITGSNLTNLQVRRDRVAESVGKFGATVVSAPQASAIAWLDTGGVSELVKLLDTNPAIQWVQLPFAGVEKFAEEGLFNRDIQFTCAKASYGEQVGEHALVLMLACLRSLVKQARCATWLRNETDSLFRKRVTVLGAGGIAETLLKLLVPFDCDVTVVRRSTDEMPNAARTVTIAELDSVLPDTDVLVLALALTAQTRNVIAKAELALMPAGSIVVNVARGGHINTDDLVDALATGHIAAAGLDVTDPEPLPDDHPLWSMDNVLITSHSADADEFVTVKLIDRIGENIKRIGLGEPLIGLVDAEAGY